MAVAVSICGSSPSVGDARQLKAIYQGKRSESLFVAHLRLTAVRPVQLLISTNLTRDRASAVCSQR